MDNSDRLQAIEERLAAIEALLEKLPKWGGPVLQLTTIVSNGSVENPRFRPSDALDG